MQMDDKIYSEIIERLAKIEVKIDDIKSVKENLDKHSIELTELKSNVESIQKEINKINENNVWLKRAVIGAIITASVGLIFAIIKIGIGI